MNLTLHLTKQCNMACSYCITEKHPVRMTEEVLLAACDLAFSSGSSAGLCFFGGEPLLEKEQIYKAVSYGQEKSRQTGKPFHCKMTTNGTLLDESFVLYAKAQQMEIGLSFDGLAQEFCRRYKDGTSTLPVLEKNAKLLLRHMPNTHALMTIAPDAVSCYAQSVIYLYKLGFRKICATIAYGKRVHWTDQHLRQLQEELQKLAAFYSCQMEKGEAFYFSPFDGKIRDCIYGTSPASRCHLGLRQMPVAVDGRLYPCTQFMGEDAYCLGDVFSGVNRDRQQALIRHSALPETCRTCALKNRCTNSCGCMNRMETGDAQRVSPLQCTYERMLIEICDTMAENLHKTCHAQFLQHFAP